MLTFLLIVFTALLAIAAVVAKVAGAKYATTTPALTEAQKLERRIRMFPNLNPRASRVLSIVIPCFNEAERLAPMIADTVAYFTREAKRTRAEKLAAGMGAFTYTTMDDRLSSTKGVRGGEGNPDGDEEGLRKRGGDRKGYGVVSLNNSTSSDAAAAPLPPFGMSSISSIASPRTTDPLLNSSVAFTVDDEWVDAFEVIVVDDCSTDGTVAVAKKAFADALAKAKMHDRSLWAAVGDDNANDGDGAEGTASSSSPSAEPYLRVVESKPNHGKGYAVRLGFFEAIGDYVLMADGDNATRIADASKLLKGMVSSDVKPFDIAVGSRAHLEQTSIAQRTFARTVLMVAFHIVVKVTYMVATLGSICPIRDTQCGFKLFNRKACEPLFRNNRLERWAFDVELLVLARRLRLRPIEVCVNWTEVPGSKVRIMGMVQMGLECLLMCFTYPLMLWPICVASLKGK